MKSRRHAPYGHLVPLAQPTAPMEEITMDFVTGLPPSRYLNRAYDAILVIVDRYTKIARYIHCLTTTTAKELAELFWEKWAKDFGIPRGIVSDRGSVFTSAFWAAFCYRISIKRRLSTAFHPQTDGQTERQNQTMEQYLRCYADLYGSNWAEILSLAEFSYNSTKHASTGKSPFLLLYGVNPEMHLIGANKAPDGTVTSNSVSANERIESMNRRHAELSKRWERTQTHAAAYYNKKHMDKAFEVGDRVLLSTENLALRTKRKVSPRYIGPFYVTERIGLRAYRLKLPEEYERKRIHNVFHVALLEPFRSRKGAAEDTMPFTLPELIGDEEEWEVEGILDKQVVQGKDRYLVAWKGWPSEFNSWELEENLGNADLLLQEFTRNQKGAKLRPNRRGKGKGLSAR